jgi:hypothetical protein
VANANNTGDRTREYETNKNGEKINKRWEGQSQLKSSRYSEDVANTEQSRSSSESIGDIGSVEKEISREEEGRNQSSVRTSTRSTDVANANESLSRQRRVFEYPNNEGRGTSETRRESLQPEDRQTCTDNIGSSSEDVADTKSSNRDDNEAVAGDGESSTQEIFGDGSSVSGEGSWWHTEPDVGRVAHGVPGRVYRLKGLGNSIVPKIAEEIGKAIIKAEGINDDTKT